MSIEGFIKNDVMLNKYTTFGIGGKADMFISVRTEKMLVETLKFVDDKRIRFFFLGGGSNVLINDLGIRGIVIKNAIRGIRVIGNKVIARSGDTVENLLRKSAEAGLTGLEFASGIPGSIGGAIYGNAGAYGKSLSDFIFRVKIMDNNGKIRFENKEYFEFSYRTSKLKKTGEIVVEVEFLLSEGNKDEITKKMQEIIAERESKHPPFPWYCAGSYFKNLPPLPGEERRRPAGCLLEEVGAKKMSVGNAKVYEKHANFLINGGNATAEEMLKLAKTLKTAVKEKFNETLEEEVMYIDEKLESLDYGREI